jgi:hypothetical protein
MASVGLLLNEATATATGPTGITSTAQDSWLGYITPLVDPPYAFGVVVQDHPYRLTSGS